MTKAILLIAAAIIGWFSLGGVRYATLNPSASFNGLAVLLMIFALVTAYVAGSAA